MKNIILKISYDGTNYSGWQRQNNATGIQTLIEDAIKEITGENIILTASGRTDAGVHAICQVANFKTNSEIDYKKFAKAINSKIPDDIRILSSDIACDDFSARLSAKKKTYMYQIYNNEIRSPFYDRYSMNVNKKIDIEAIKNNLSMIVGTHDFTSFYTMEKNNKKKPIRTIYYTDVKQYENLIKIYITGNGFLYNMVRIIVGTLIDIGLGRKDMNMLDILNMKDRKYASATAKAKGLFLKNVEY